MYKVCDDHCNQHHSGRKQVHAHSPFLERMEESGTYLESD